MRILKKQDIKNMLKVGAKARGCLLYTSIFVFLLTGMMIFSQILFIIFAMFLPISFLLSMIPSYENMAKQAIVRVFNTIMTRAGICLLYTS